MKREGSIFSGSELLTMLAIRQREPATTVEIEQAVADATGLWPARAVCWRNADALERRGHIEKVTRDGLPQKRGPTPFVWTMTNKGEQHLIRTMKVLKVMSKLPD